MNPEQRLQSHLDNPHFLAVSGSRLYGSNREGSDFDYRGFTLPPYEYLLDLPGYKFTDRKVGSDDHVVYSLRRFLELVLKGDPHLTELFFVPEHLIVKTSPLAQEVLSLRKHILSNLMFNRILGYGYSEWRKAMGVKMVEEDRTKTEDDVVMDIRNTFSLEKDDMDQVVEILFSKKEKKIVSHLKNLGAKRKSEFKLYGFGVTSAAHSIRLTEQLYELATTGEITYPRPNAALLRDIRKGVYAKEDLTELYENAKSKVENIRKHSVLPEKPDVDYVWEVYADIVKKAIKNDPRF